MIKLNLSENYSQIRMTICQAKIEAAKAFRRCFSAISILLLVLTGGCATTDYTTHYGIFTAENSGGETRQFRIYWQTLRYEGWLENTYRAFPLVLETQCSKRDLVFFDASFGKVAKCVDAPQNGIQFCSKSGSDVNKRGIELDGETLCGTVTDRNGASDILSLKGELVLTLNCRPKITEQNIRGKKVSTDYLAASAIPYVVSTKKVQGADIEKLIPSLSSHSSICDRDL